MTEQEARRAGEEADRLYNDGRFQEAIAQYESALEFYTLADHAEEWAATQNNLGIAYWRLPTGSQTANLARAIECYQAALRVFTEADFPADWATTQIILGVAYGSLPTGDRAAHLAHAIACHQAALRVYTEADFPTDWARTQNSLGTAYQIFPTGDRAANLAHAIECYQAALRVRSEADFPAQWAMTQNNLGAAYGELPSGDRATNLTQAIEYYQAALRVRSEADFPAQWAMTQNNLGIAYLRLSTGDKAANLAKAMECCQAALRVYTEADFPRDWAWTQSSLGEAYAAGVTGDRGSDLAQAIECYQAALRISTEADLPADWAATQNSLARALENLGAEATGLGEPWELAWAILLSPQARAIDPNEITGAADIVARLARARNAQAKGAAALREAAVHLRKHDLPLLAIYLLETATDLLGERATGKETTPDGFLLSSYRTPARVKFLIDCQKIAEKHDLDLSAMLGESPVNPSCPGGRLWVLRQWNSHTPLLSSADGKDSRGGGYFLQWAGKGIVVDPGIDFLRNFHQAGLAFRDIDAVILTHNHWDHVADVIPLLTLLFEYNDRYPESPHRIALLCSPGTAGMFTDMVTGLRGVKPFVILKSEEQEDLQYLHLRLLPFSVKHAELGGRNTALGLRLELLEDDGRVASTLVLSGDGGWSQDLCARCEGADVLVLHLGSLYPADLTESEPAKNHLGVKGVFGVLSHLVEAKKQPKLTLISELGEELGDMVSELVNACCDGLGLTYREDVVEAELGRVICLPEGQVMCETARTNPASERCRRPALDREIVSARGSRREFLCPVHHSAHTREAPHYGTAEDTDAGLAVSGRK